MVLLSHSQILPHHSNSHLRIVFWLMSAFPWSIFGDNCIATHLNVQSPLAISHSCIYLSLSCIEYLPWYFTLSLFSGCTFRVASSLPGSQVQYLFPNNDSFLAPFAVVHPLFIMLFQSSLTRNTFYPLPAYQIPCVCWTFCLWPNYGTCFILTVSFSARMGDYGEENWGCHRNKLFAIRSGIWPCPRSSGGRKHYQDVIICSSRPELYGDGAHTICQLGVWNLTTIDNL